VKDGTDKTDLKFPFSIFESLANAAANTKRAKPNIAVMTIT